VRRLRRGKGLLEFAQSLVESCIRRLEPPGFCLLLVNHLLKALHFSLGTLQLVEPPAQLALEVDLGALRL
jgi:hypothetical protein